MEMLYSIVIGILAASGVWLVLRPRTFQVLLGLTLLSYAVNLFIFGMGRLVEHKAPVLAGAGPVDPALYADPVPQALVLTAIVIGFALQAFLLALAWRSWTLDGNDDVEDDIEDRRLAARRRQRIRMDEAARRAERERQLSGSDEPVAEATP